MEKTLISVGPSNGSGLAAVDRVLTRDSHVWRNTR